MPQHRIAISLPSPCDESWDAMTPADRGRHCAMCQKTVVDFTLLSDGEIIDIFTKAKDAPPCGHFLATQLDRELVDTRYKPSFISTLAKRAAAMLILFQSVAVAAMAQQAKGQRTATHARKAAAVPKDNRRHICGTVIDYDHNKPLPNVRVQIRGTDLHAITDNIGGFILYLPDTFCQATVVLEGSITDDKMQAISNVVLEETMTLADIKANRDITLYKYQAQTLNPHDVVTYNIRETRTYGGAPIRQNVYVAKRPTTWQKITKPFRKKKQY